MSKRPYKSKELLHQKTARKPKSNMALYAILTVGVLYVLVRVVIHLTGGE